MGNSNEEFLKPLILDIGTANFRFGFAGDDFPDVIVPSIYADITEPLFKSDIIEGFEELFIADSMDQVLFGIEALKYKDILNIREFYKEKNFSILNNFFLHYYYQLDIPDEFLFQQPIIILFPFLSSESDRGKLQNLFLTELNFPSINFVNFSECILSALGKKTGIVINLGEQNSFVSTIYKGFSNITAREFFPIAGKDLTAYLMDLILFNKHYKVSFLDKWIAREIKEKAALCVLNPKEIKQKIIDGLHSYDQEIRLPDGTTITINEERYMIAEPLFNPNLLHLDIADITQLIAELVKSWNRENWAELLENIVISGGCSLIKDLGKRLQVELVKWFSDKLKNKIKIITPAGRENMGWVGASILYSQGLLTKGWIQNPNIPGVPKTDIKEIEE